MTNSKENWMTEPYKKRLNHMKLGEIAFSILVLWCYIAACNEEVKGKWLILW